MMRESSRFPHLAVPFTLVGAAAGWLSAGLLANPAVVRLKSAPPAAVTALAAVFAGLTGTLLTRLCAGRREPYWIDDGGPPVREPSDHWIHHTAAVLAAGTITGGLAAGLFDAYHGAGVAAIGGLLCATAFLPVCLAVVAAARRAQRARMGSLVADSDRRAVWGILAMTLSVMTLEALPSWAAAAAFDAPPPTPVVVMLAASGIAIAVFLDADISALRRARRALAPDVVARSADDLDAADTRAPRVDLGLGNDVSARMAKLTSVYRGRDQAVALVLGNPKIAVRALWRAVGRGAFGLVLVAAAAALHIAAGSATGRLAYDERRCDDYDFKACARVAAAVRPDDPQRALDLYEKACGRSSVESCLTAAAIYDDRAGDGEVFPPDAALRWAINAPRARTLRQRACRYGCIQACVLPR